MATNEPSRVDALRDSGQSADASSSSSVVVVPVQPQPCQVQPTLAWDACDDHFAAGTERAQISYRCAHLGQATVKVEIKSRDNTTLTFKAANLPNGDGTHPIVQNGWDGRASDDALIPGLLATPLNGPYSVTVSTSSGLSIQRSLHVLFHSVTLAIGSYTADGNVPNRDTKHVAWVKYKLNQLGYYAGPVDSVTGTRGTSQLWRAVARYAGDHPGLPTIGFRTDWDYIDGQTFCDALAGDACGHQVISNNALPAANGTARLYVEHNYFYTHPDEFMSNTGQLDCDRKWLDRIELPIEATVLLVGRNDADGSGAGVAAGEAAGVAEVQWLVTPVAEDLTRYPAATQNAPSRANLYFTAAALGNCPVARGGAHAAVGTTNQNHFRIGTDLPPYTSTRNNDDVYSSVWQDDAAPNGPRVGKNGILFRASTIAGDGYKVKATISFRNQHQAVANAHTTFHGQQWAARSSAETGEMRVWRKLRASRVLNWPAPGQARAINWGHVAAQYALAYCELEHAGVVTTGAAAFLQTYTDEFRQQIAPGVSRMLGQEQGHDIVFDAAALFPITIPVQGEHETATKYKARIESDLRDKFTSDNLQIFAQAISTLNRLTQRGGVVVIHGRWIPTLRVWHRAKWGYGASTDEHDFNPSLFCIGLNSGVTIIDNEMYPEYTDAFLISHEAGHTRFLKHHHSGRDEMGQAGRQTAGVNAWHATNFPSANPNCHDLADTHCTMSYPFKLNPTVEWSPTSNRTSAFCGKCLLRLRGWDILTAGLPASS